MRAHQFVVSVVAVSLIGLAWIIPQRGTADQPGMSAFPGDVVGNGVIDAQDLVAVVLSLGPCQGCPAEMNGDGVVDAWEVLAIVGAIGGGATDEPPMAYGSGMHICAVEDGAFVTADGGCKDLATGIVWGMTSYPGGTGFGQWPWANAVDFIAGSTEAGFTDWRLPTKNEWLNVAAHGAATHFGNSYVDPVAYWTSTTQGNKAWLVYVTGVAIKFEKYNDSFFVGVRVPPPAGSPCNNNTICESGENCENCGDCDGKLNGPPAGRYCCGNGILEGPEGDGTICDGTP